jgi:3-deoxy-D-manno-octulosonate 8-phosphate phosphatase (KDO 8-P phosphatase)
MNATEQLLGELGAETAAHAAAVRLAVFDVDGVLTDGRVILGDDGFEYKAFHTHDGHGLRMLQASGVEVAIITGRTSVVVSRRAEELRVRHLMQGRRDKREALGELAARLGLALDAVAFVGDDLVDLPAMQAAGLGIAVANASPWVVSAADVVTRRSGGHGAAREVCELIMAAQGTLEAALELHGAGGPCDS